MQTWYQKMAWGGALSLYLFVGCATGSKHQPDLGQPNEVQETEREVISAMESVVGAISGQEIEQKELKELGQQLRKDQEAQSAVQAITGNSSVQSITLTSFTDDAQQTLPISGVFVAVGVVPTTAILKQAGIIVSPQGWITVDRTQQTNLEGVFAAGDITTGSNEFNQIVTAAAEGALAALSIFNFIKSK